MTKSKVNKTVVVQSIIALVFLGLTIFVSWWFIVPVAILLWLNQKELFDKK